VPVLDQLMPAFDVEEAHTVLIQAPRERAYEAFQKVTPAEVRIMIALMALRALPRRLIGRPGFQFTPAVPLLEQLLAQEFTLLDERPERWLMFGLIDQPWTPTGGIVQPFRDAKEFTAFATPGYAKFVVSFFFADEAGGTRLDTGTRIQCTDPESRKRFARYWRFFAPGSGLTRRVLLKAIKRRAERRAVA
jgi:hypothetical protein